MTTITKKAQRTIEYDAFVRCICDGCGANLPHTYGNEGYHLRTFELDFRIGDNYPDGGYGNGWRINHLCDSCVDRLYDLLNKNNFVIESYTWDT